MNFHKTRQSNIKKRRNKLLFFAKYFLNNSYDLYDYKISLRLFVEFLGSFILILMGLCISVFSGQNGSFIVSLGYGMTLTFLLISFSHISGGYFIPSMAFGSYISRRIPFSVFFSYLIFQLLGGILGSATFLFLIKDHPNFKQENTVDSLKSLFNSLANGFEMHSPNGFSLFSVFITETIVSLILTLVFLAVYFYKKQLLSPISVGFAMVVLMQIVAPYSNASMNPVRSTSVALFSDIWAIYQLWVFWLAPLLGAFIAGLIFHKNGIFKKI